MAVSHRTYVVLHKVIQYRKVIEQVCNFSDLKNSVVLMFNRVECMFALLQWNRIWTQYLNMNYFLWHNIYLSRLCKKNVNTQVIKTKKGRGSTSTIADRSRSGRTYIIWYPPFLFPTVEAVQQLFVVYKLCLCAPLSLKWSEQLEFFSLLRFLFIPLRAHKNV